MYAPGGPMRMALASQVASIANSAITGSTSQGQCSSHRPNTTASASAQAIAANAIARAAYGRVLQ